MKLESIDFGPEDLQTMLDDLIDTERRSLLARLGQAAERLHELASRVEDEPPSDRQEWTPKEILAHFAMFLGFYVQLVRDVVDGKVSELNLLRKFQGRDVIGQRLVRRTSAELAQFAAAALKELLEWLHSAPPTDFSKGCQVDSGLPETRFVSVSDLVRLPLCAHMELHLDQLEHALRRSHERSVAPGSHA